ncbi:TadE family type IV pilus minor pilin [Rothia sp. LK2588]|uniref:TadE family type IV pilus minor pilin n=1 Tax=Rothia sp. LK2588 TaxID=3114369 RepID=UPI0034CF4F8A
MNRQQRRGRHSTAVDSAERGAVTAEFAVALPAVVLVLALLLSSAACGIVQVRLEESARLAARAMARGDDPARVQAIAHEVSPEAVVQTGSRAEATGNLATVTCSRPAPGVIGKATGWRLTATATAPVESVEAEQ